MGDGEINPGRETLLTETNHINKVEIKKGEGSKFTRERPRINTPISETCSIHS